MKNRNTSGFTLIELLIVVAIIGIIAAIAIPNLLNALDRGKQKRTMADLRTIAVALESYSVDNTFYPLASTITALRPLVEPYFIRETPSTDGWRNPFVVSVVATGYTLGSGGKDGGALNFIGGTTSDFNDAIIYINGQFAQWPEGSQQ